MYFFKLLTVPFSSSLSNPDTVCNTKVLGPQCAWWLCIVACLFYHSPWWNSSSAPWPPTSCSGPWAFSTSWWSWASCWEPSSVSVLLPTLTSSLYQPSRIRQQNTTTVVHYIVASICFWDIHLQGHAPPAMLFHRDMSQKHIDATIYWPYMIDNYFFIFLIYIIVSCDTILPYFFNVQIHKNNNFNQNKK